MRRQRLRRDGQLSGRLCRAPEFTLTVSAMERAFCRPHPPPCLRRGTRLLMGRRRRGPAALLLLSPILHRWGLVHTLHALRGAYVRHGTRYVRHARRHRIRTRTSKDVRFVTRCSWKELVCNGGMACPGEDPSRVLTADLESILQEDSAVGLLSCYEIGRSNGATGWAWAELDDKLALFGVEGLRSLGKGAEPEALSRVVIDRILIDACQQPGAILSLEERLGTVAEVERGERDFPTGVCDYVLRRRPEGKITAIVEAKRCLNGDMSLLSSGAVQLALCCLQAQH